MIIYIAGKMRGEDNLGFPLFFEMEEYLKTVFTEERFVNPARLGIKFCKEKWELTDLNEKTYPEYMTYFRLINKYFHADMLRHDIKYLLLCDTLVRLPNWRESPGAILETRIARNLNFGILDAVKGSAGWKLKAIGSKEEE